MTKQKQEPESPTMVAFRVQHLDAELDHYLSSRYVVVAKLSQIADGVLVPEAGIARALLSWRKSVGFPSPNVIGEERCADCRKVMGDEPSICEDETVCEACGQQPGDKPEVASSAEAQLTHSPLSEGT